MSIPDGVAYEAVALHLARDRGEIDEAALVEALTRIVSDVRTQEDAFVLLDRLAGLAARAVTGMAGTLDVAPERLLREAAVTFASEDLLLE